MTGRFVEIGVRALDRHGRPVEREVRGLSAVTFQHEVDHLNGTLFVDRVEDPTTFSTWEQFERFQRDEFTARAAAPGRPLRVVTACRPGGPATPGWVVTAPRPMSCSR